MNKTTIFLLLVFIISSVWLSLWVSPRFPDVIEYLLIVYPAIMLGYSFYPLFMKLIQIILKSKEAKK